MKPAAILTALLAVGIAAVLWILLGTPDTRPEREELGAPSAGAAEVPSRAAEAEPQAPPSASYERVATPEPARSAPGGQALGARAQAPEWTNAPQSLWGWVRGPRGPLPSARVTLVDGERGELTGTTTANDGSFQLPVPTAVDGALLRVTHPDHAPYENGPYKLSPGQKRNAGILRLQGATSLSGKVVDGEGRPIAQALVTVASGTGTGSPNRHRHRIRTDARGEFALRDAPAGGVRAEAEAEGFATLTRTLRLPLEEPALFELQRSEPFVVEVHGPRGRVAGASVRVTMDGRNGATFNATTEKDGRAHLAGISEGRWTGRVVAPGHHPADFTGWGPSEEPIVVELGAMACVRGRVMAPGDSAPPAGTRVSLLPAGAEHRREDESLLAASVAADGTFEGCGVAPGRWVVRASAPGFAPATSDAFEVSADAAPEIEVLLGPGGALEARVGGPAGPVGGAEVGLVARPLQASEFDVPARDLLAVLETDARGVARFEHVEPGRYWLFVRHAEHRPESAGPWTVRERPEPALAVLALERGRSIAGVVHAPDGRPVGGARVLVRAFVPGGLTLVGEVRTRSDGSYSSIPVGAGRYQVTARSAAGSASLELAVELDEAPSADLFLSQ